MLFTQLFENDFNNKKPLAETHDDYEDCSYCSGTGEGRYEGQSCAHCGGSGVEPVEQDNDFDIPDEPDDFGDEESYYEKSLRSRGLGEGAEFGAYYYEQLAQKVFDQYPDLNNEDNILNFGYAMAKEELGKRANGIFRDEDFPSDFVSAYFWLKKQGVAEVSSNTLKRYKKAAQRDIDTTDNAGLYTDSDIDRMDRRMKGIGRATSKVNTNKRKEQSVAEGADERGQNRLWAQITDYEKRAKATSNDIKKQHYLKMADELRGKLKTNVDEGTGNVGANIKALYQKIYRAGDDEIEYFYHDSPVFAQYWDEYEGDLDSIIAEVDPAELQVMLDELESYVQQANLEEGDVARLAGITALGIGAGLGANYLDQQAPRVEFDGKNGQVVKAYLEPAWTNRIPDNAMTIKGKDGKTYHVWSSAGKGANSKSYHAAPVEPVKEGFGDIVKGVKRAVKGKEHPDVVASKHLGRALGHYHQGEMSDAEKETKRYNKVQSMNKGTKTLPYPMKEQGVAEEGEWTKLPNGNWRNMHTGVQQSTPPKTKKSRIPKGNYSDEANPIKDDGNEGRPGKQRYPGVAEGSAEDEYRKQSDQAWKNVAAKDKGPIGRFATRLAAKLDGSKIKLGKKKEQGVAEATGNMGLPHDFTKVQQGVEVWYKGRFCGWTTGKVYGDEQRVEFEPNPSEFPNDKGRKLSLPYEEISLRKPTSIGKLKDPGQGVAEGELNESPTIDLIRGLISEFNTQMSGSPYYPMDYKNPGMRMWTRGDGSRYKDPGYIFIDRDLKPEDQPKWHKAKAVEKFWKFLESKGARKIGDVSGEFGSDPHSPAVVLNKLVFVFNGRSIAWGSTSRLKNSSVWRQKQQGVAEMDSQQPTGRYKADGTRSHSSYGQRDRDISGPDKTGKPLTAKQMMDKAHKDMMKSMSNDEKVDKGWRNPHPGVAEANKKKDELEPEVRDVGLQRAISNAKAAFPAAGSGIEALSKDFMRSQEQDQKSFDQIRQAERRQNQMLDQIAQLDQSQTQEIQSLEKQNSGLASRLQQLQAVNDNLEKKLAAMSGRKPKAAASEPVTISKATQPAVSTAPIPASAPVQSTPAKRKQTTTSPAIGQVAKALSGPATSPAFDRISQELQPRQKELGFDEPVTLKPKKFDTSKASDADYRELTSKLAKDIASNPARQVFNPDAVKSVAAQQEMPVENKDQDQKIAGRYDPDEFDAMVARVGQKAREQEKKKPVDIKDLARRLAAVKLPDEK